MASRANQWWTLVGVALAVAAVTVLLTLWVGGQLPGLAGPVAPAGSEQAGADPSADSSAETPQGPPPAKVRVVPAQLEQVQQRFDLLGRLEELRRTTVAAEVAGKVMDVPVAEGGAVVGGETVLAQIDDVWARLDLAAAEAEVAAAEAQLDQSQRDLTYLESLLASGSAKPREVDDARATVQADRARLNGAQATQQRVAQQIERLKVIAPFDGVVVDKLTERGQWLSPGAPVAEIVSRGQINAVLNVPERLINRVAVGDEVEVVVDALDLRKTGRVVAVTPAGGNAARTFPVDVRLDDAQGMLKPGMSVTAKLPLDEKVRRLTVPRDAVMFGPDGAVVWTVTSPATPEGDTPDAALPTAAPVPVHVLFGQGGRYAVEVATSRPGVELADQTSVVVEGAERLFAGQTVSMVEVAETAMSR